MSFCAHHKQFNVNMVYSTPNSTTPLHVFNIEPRDQHERKRGNGALLCMLAGLDSDTIVWWILLVLFLGQFGRKFLGSKLQNYTCRFKNLTAFLHSLHIHVVMNLKVQLCCFPNNHPRILVTILGFL